MRNDLAVEVSDLTVRFGDFKAVDRISFAVEKGSIFGFLGANGAGKTTTIRVLCGLLIPTEGKVKVAGIELEESGNESVKAKVGYMSQKFTLYDDLSVGENLEFIADLRKLDRQYYKRREQAVFDFISFQRSEKTLVRDLPGGMKQQVSLAASLLHDPEIVFLDEPTAGVSSASRARFWALIQELAKQGKTIFVTTHYMDEVEQCQEIALMRAGAIIALDSPSGLKNSTFPRPVYEINPLREISFDDVQAFERSGIFDFFEPYGLRFHATIGDEGRWSEFKRDHLEDFRILEIRPTLEDVFIRLVEEEESMNFERAAAMARKEIFHVLRDPFTLALALLFPVMMVTVFGLAIEFNVKYIHLAAYDGDRTQASRELIETFGSSDYFIVRPAHGPAEAIRKLDAGSVRAALIIEPRFEYRLKSERQASVQLILDGSDNSTVGPIISYLDGIRELANQRILGIQSSPLVQLRTRFLYNPELNSRWFIVPGLAVVVLAILSILLTALTVAREWENGSMELLLSTPVQPIEIIIGKLAPYLGLGLGAVAFVYAIARLGFGVPFRGSHLTFLLGCILFLATYLAQGLLISVLTRKQQIAMQFSMMSGMLPSLLLSGFIFPIESMPVFFQYLTCILPARWFVMVSRDVFLKGSGIHELTGAFTGLLLICLVMVFIAAKTFKKDLEP